MAAERPSAKYRVRDARKEDYDQVLEISRRAFIHDPVAMYLGAVSQFDGVGLHPKDDQGLRHFLSFSLKSVLSRNGRVTVVVTSGDAEASPSSSDAPPREQVVSATYWLPPYKRIQSHQLIKIPRDGLWPILKTCGMGWLPRSGEYQDKSHRAFKDGFKKRGVKTPVDNSWYLFCAFTDPDFQGKGLLSMLLREQFAHAPNEIYVLESSTIKSRDTYAHFDFEAQETVVLGKGSVTAEGLKSGGETAVGVSFYPMVKWVA